MRGGVGDDSGLIFLVSQQEHVLWPHIGAVSTGRL